MKAKNFGSKRSGICAFQERSKEVISLKEISSRKHKKLVGELRTKAYNEAWNGKALVCQECNKEIQRKGLLRSGPSVHLPTDYDTNKDCWKLREGEEPFLLCSDCWEEHKKLD